MGSKQSSLPDPNVRDGKTRTDCMFSNVSDSRSQIISNSLVEAENGIPTHKSGPAITQFMFLPAGTNNNFCGTGPDPFLPNKCPPGEVLKKMQFVCGKPGAKETFASDVSENSTTQRIVILVTLAIVLYIVVKGRRA